MTSYAWATPRKADEYYLQGAEKSPQDLWLAVESGLVRSRINDVIFPQPYIGAILELVNWNVPEADRVLELPRYIEVNVDDVQRVLCGRSTPLFRKGRPKKMGDAVQRDYDLAVRISRMLQSGEADTVADASRKLIAIGLVAGASHEARMKRLQRAYTRWFRTD
jgi:hypothetical protein